MTVSLQTLSDIGEKTLIREFIKPFFNSSDDPAGVGDDCAMVPFGDDFALLSTDRVPSDLTAFRLGLLDYSGLGDYLARLNLSDIAACGGHAVGLLLNLGLPSDLEYDHMRAICRGFGTCAARNGTAVLGGDITMSCELSASATAIGRVNRDHVLTRRAARPGDSIFISRPLGITPAAFLVYLGDMQSHYSSDSMNVLRSQFTDLEPMLLLGQTLAACQERGACMDNTDGIGQTLTELSEASKCSFVVQRDRLTFPPIVEAVARSARVAPLEFVFDAGADFSLVGTLRGEWSTERACERLGHPVEIIGRVEAGHGVWLEDEGRSSLSFQGWNYFHHPSRPIPGGPSAGIR